MQLKRLGVDPEAAFRATQSGSTVPPAQAALDRGPKQQKSTLTEQMARLSTSSPRLQAAQAGPPGMPAAPNSPGASAEWPTMPAYMDLDADDLSGLPVMSMSGDMTSPPGSPLRQAQAAAKAGELSPLSKADLARRERQQQQKQQQQRAQLAQQQKLQRAQLAQQQQQQMSERQALQQQQLREQQMLEQSIATGAGGGQTTIGGPPAGSPEAVSPGTAEALGLPYCPELQTTLSDPLHGGGAASFAGAPFGALDTSTFGGAASGAGMTGMGPPMSVPAAGGLTGLPTTAMAVPSAATGLLGGAAPSAAGANDGMAAKPCGAEGIMSASASSEALAGVADTL